jgi:hypothetical protein
MKTVIRTLVFIFLIISCCYASQEGIIQANEISFHSNGIQNSGPIHVQMNSGKSGAITSFSIFAFGKPYSLTNAELSKIPKNLYNGLNVTYERGYLDLGGQTLYIVLSSRFSGATRFETIITFTETLPVQIVPKPIEQKIKCPIDF